MFFINMTMTNNFIPSRLDVNIYFQNSYYYFFYIYLEEKNNM